MIFKKMKTMIVLSIIVSVAFWKLSFKKNPAAIVVEPEESKQVKPKEKIVKKQHKVKQNKKALIRKEKVKFYTLFEDEFDYSYINAKKRL